MAANTLTGLIPTMYQALNIIPREQTGFVMAARRNAAAAMAAVNQSINYPIVPSMTASDITPAAYPSDATGQTIGYDTLTITKSRKVEIPWNGEEELGLSNSAGVHLDGSNNYSVIQRDQFAEAFRTLVNEIDTDLATAAYQGASRAVGTAGTTPFGTAGDFSDFAAVRQVLTDNGAPSTDLHLVVGSAAMANIRGKQSILFKANEAGTSDLLRNGVIARVEGLDIHESAFVRTHTKGTGASYAINNGSGYAVGSTTIAVDTGNGTIIAGDVITNSQAGRDSNKYIVKTALSGGSFVLNKPGNRVAWVDNDTVAVGNNYVANVGLHRNALQLVTRTPAMPSTGDQAQDVVNVVDPVSGLVFQVALYPQYRQKKIEVGINWGYKVNKSEFIVVLMG